MKALVASLQFLTILPFRTTAQPARDEFAGAMACFPLAGMLIGAILAVANGLFLTVFPARLTDLLLVTLLVFLTGGLHLDGLADTFDGLGSGRDPARILEIMRDSRIGTMGVLSIVSVFLLKVTVFGVIPPGHKPWALIAMGATSRFCMLVPLYLFPYARKEGKALAFFESINPKAFFAALGITVLAVACTARLTGLIALALCAAGTYLFARLVNTKIGGVTGDVLGAVNEMSEVLFLLSLAVVFKGLS
ncbi:MAG: adenosylcobinamide-GDP ribazoletransferase [Endomicrobiales bacterium]